MENQNGDAAEILLATFYFNRYVNGQPHRTTYINARHVFPELYTVVQGRSLTVGAVPIVEEGSGYYYRFELMLVGLHRFLVRGICWTPDGICTCIVAKFPLHDFMFGDDQLLYGGEGGEIALAHSLNKRVVHHQGWTTGNIALNASLFANNDVRVVVRQRIDDHDLYVYEGIFIVLERHLVVTPEGFVVFEFRLIRIIDLE